MKYIVYILIALNLLFIRTIGLTQNAHLIFGIPGDSIYVDDFEDITTREVYLDVDHDGINDFRFYTYYYGNGWGAELRTSLASYDSTMFIIDSAASQWVGPCGYTILDTVTMKIVRKNSMGDNLMRFDNYSDFGRFTDESMGTDPCFVWSAVNDWIGGDHYIGFIKTINNRMIPGWIKLEIGTGSTKFIIKESALKLENMHILKINEFMANNKETIADEYGEYDDWIELYNAGQDSVFLGDKYLTEDSLIQNKWNMPAIYIQSGEYLLFWADDQPAQGPFHTNFKLDDDGEMIGIFRINSKDATDAYIFTEQTTDVSEGRLPNGFDHWTFFSSPTPGFSNETSSVNQHPFAAPLTAYPNPTSNGQVFFNKTTTCKVIGANGQLLFEANKVNSINISQYPDGLYFIVTCDGEKIRVLKGKD